MNTVLQVLKAGGTAFVLSMWLSLAAIGQETAQEEETPRTPPTVAELLEQLADPDTANWQQVERQIRTEWSRSGSSAMDFLYQRGEKALEAEKFDEAIEHFTALTDHAPDFAEGYNGRATALFQKGLYGPAMADLGRTLELNPDHFGAMTGLAVILQSVGMESEALEVWYLVEAAHPHRPEMHEAIKALEAKVAGQAL